MKDEENLVTYTSEELRRICAAGKSRTDWDAVKAMNPEDIDDSDIPEGFWENAQWVQPTFSVPPVRIEPGIMGWFVKKASQTGAESAEALINGALAAYVQETEARQRIDQHPA